MDHNIQELSAKLAESRAIGEAVGKETNNTLRKLKVALQEFNETYGADAGANDFGKNLSGTIATLQEYGEEMESAFALVRGAEDLSWQVSDAAAKLQSQLREREEDVEMNLLKIDELQEELAREVQGIRRGGNRGREVELMNQLEVAENARVAMEETVRELELKLERASANDALREKDEQLAALQVRCDKLGQSLEENLDEWERAVGKTKRLEERLKEAEKIAAQKETERQAVINRRIEELETENAALSRKVRQLETALHRKEEAVVHRTSPEGPDRDLLLLQIQEMTERNEIHRKSEANETKNHMLLLELQRSSYRLERDLDNNAIVNLSTALQQKDAALKQAEEEAQDMARVLRRKGDEIARLQEDVARLEAMAKVVKPSITQGKQAVEIMALRDSIKQKDEALASYVASTKSLERSIQQLQDDLQAMTRAKDEAVHLANTLTMEVDEDQKDILALKEEIARLKNQSPMRTRPVGLSDGRQSLRMSAMKTIEKVFSSLEQQVQRDDTTRKHLWHLERELIAMVHSFGAEALSTQRDCPHSHAVSGQRREGASIRTASPAFSRESGERDREAGSPKRPATQPGIRNPSPSRATARTLNYDDERLPPDYSRRGSRQSTATDDLSSHRVSTRTAPVPPISLIQHLARPTASSSSKACNSARVGHRSTYRDFTSTRSLSGIRQPTLQHANDRISRQLADTGRSRVSSQSPAKRKAPSPRPRVR
eukprot:Sspe_Gene.65920::Locus_38977_Transcript_1_1_Confidence_1.000_Length_2349::g.65920::m.65920